MNNTTKQTDYVAEAMELLEGPKKPRPTRYMLVLVTLIESIEQRQYYLGQGVVLHESIIDGKTRVFTTVERVG
jgi:hypothetical protein